MPSSSASPTISYANINTISGTSSPAFIIDVFTDSLNACSPKQGKVYLGTAIADASGNWSFTGTFVNDHQITAQATDLSDLGLSDEALPIQVKLDLVDAMVAAADDKVSDADTDEIERSACPTCGSCSGMFTANSMNCLTEALGLSLPGNGSMLATHADRE